MKKTNSGTLKLKDSRKTIAIYLDDDKEGSPSIVLKFQPRDIFVGEVIARLQTLDNDVRNDIVLIDVKPLRDGLDALYAKLHEASDSDAGTIVDSITAKKREILDAELNNDGILPFSDRLKKYVDMLFGIGSAELLSSHFGLVGDEMAAIMEETRRIYDEYVEEVKKKEQADRLKQIANARKEAKKYMVNS